MSVTFVDFRGYGVNARDVSIVCERILTMHRIDYNGRYGVEIVLDTGATVCVDGFTQDVRRKIEAALAAAKD